MPYTHQARARGDTIRSADWNAMGQEIQRVGGLLQDGTPGSVTVPATLTVGRRDRPGGLRVFRAEEDGSRAEHGALVLGSDAPTAATLHAGYSAGYSWLQSQGKQTLAVNPQGGNVGIGTTAPAQQLTLTGGIGFANQNAADKKLHSPADGLLEWTTHDAAGQHAFAVSHQGQPRVYLNTSGHSFLTGGNVGIGTAAPQARLHVSGDVRWGASLLDPDQGGCIELGGDNATPGTGTPYLDFHFRGPAQDFNVRLINDADGQLSLVAPRVRLAGSVEAAAGSLSFGAQVRQMINLWSDSYGIGVQDGTHYVRSANHFAWYRGGAHRDAAFDGGGGAALMVLRDGSLGVGTVSPQAMLHVSGTLRVDGTSALNQENWIAPTFQDGWVNYAGGHNLTGYYKDSLGVVHLRGLVRGGVAGGTIFTLPAGYRPTFREVFVVLTNPGAAGRVDALPDGRVTATGVNNVWVSLDGLTFTASESPTVRTVTATPITASPFIGRATL